MFASLPPFYIFLVQTVCATQALFLQTGAATAVLQYFIRFTKCCIHCSLPVLPVLHVFLYTTFLSNKGEQADYLKRVKLRVGVNGQEVSWFKEYLFQKLPWIEC